MDTQTDRSGTPVAVAHELEGRSALLAASATFAAMPDDVRRLVAASLAEEAYAFGDTIVAEGDPADALYFMATGVGRVLKAGDGHTEIVLGRVGAGDVFGERALLDAGVRAATVRASSDVRVLRLDRSVFKALATIEPRVHDFFEQSLVQHARADFVRLHTAFGDLPPETIAALVAAVEAEHVAAGEAVFTQGDPPGALYLVADGRLRVFGDVNGRMEDVAYLRKGAYFGEASVLQGIGRSYTVEAVVDCELLRLDADAVGPLLEAHPEVRRVLDDGVAQYEYRRLASVPTGIADELLPADAAGEAAVLEDAEAEADTELAVDAGAPARRIRARKFPMVRQIDEMDCGAACVAMICRHFGREVDLGYVREVVHTGTEGTGLSGFVTGAEALGLRAKALKASKARLGDLPLPAVAHLKRGHWVVVVAADARRVRIADPARGIRKVARDDFEEAWSGYIVSFAPTDALAAVPETKADAAWLKPFVRPYRGTLAIALIVALVTAGLEMSVPVFTRIVVDTVIPARDYTLLNWILAAMAVVFAVLVGGTILQRYLLARTTTAIDVAAFDHLTGHLFSLPMRYFATRRLGDLSQRLDGMRMLRTFVVQDGVAGLVAATEFVVMMVFMVFYSWQLTLVYIAVAPLYGLLVHFGVARIMPLFQSHEEAFGKYRTRQIDAIKGIQTVKAMGAEPALQRWLGSQYDALAERIFRLDFAIMIYNGLMVAIGVLTLAVFLYFGARQVMGGSMDLGEFVAFNTIVLFSRGPVEVLLGLLDRLHKSRVLLTRMNDVVAAEPEQDLDDDELTPVPSLVGRVTLAGVGFEYGGPFSMPVLEDVDLDVRPGEMIAIVGRSGSGKTTLAKLLAGLHIPTAGRVSYDGADLTTLRLGELRRRVGFVLQDNYLFDDTIAANIAFGEDSPDLERVRWAAEVANAKGFVERLPLAYETRVGEGGLQLSGGQRQRIAIARALYNRPPVLILDEATSALDTESERVVQRNLDDLLEGRTSFVIAHRLSTVRNADRIVVLEQGRVIEVGSHEQLMERKGLYYYLVSQQLSTT